MRLVRIYVFIYLMGMTVFTLLADFDNHFWVDVWGIWNNVAYGSCLSFGCLFSVLRGKDKEVVRWPFYYTVVLLLWEIASLWTGLSINNQWAVAVAFGLVAVLIGYLSLWGDSKFNKLLKKPL